MKTSLLSIYALIFSAVLHAQPGTLDASFGNAGISIFKNGNGIDETPRGAAMQSDDRIIIAGSTTTANGKYDGILLRYNANGSINNSFANNGIYRSTKNEKDFYTDVKQLPDGKILVAGYIQQPSNGGYNFILYRFLSSGIADSSFGIYGSVITDLGLEEQAAKIAIRPDGKILLAGVTGYLFAHDIAIVRYNANGTIDNSFGTNGKVITDYADCGVSDIILQPNGKILVIGSADDGYSGSTGSVAIVNRYNADGTPDNSFGTNGKVSINIDNDSTTTDGFSGVVILPTGNLLLCGYSGYYTTKYDGVLMRLLINGRIDSSFNNTGRIFINNGNISRTDWISDMYRQPDGKILLCGISDSSFAVWRYQTNGKPDKNFGTNGLTVITKFSTSAASKIFMQSTGKIIVVGRKGLDNTSDILIARLNGDNISVNSLADNQVNLSDGLIYPNPAKDYFIIDATRFKNAKNVMIKVTSLNGRIMLQQKLNAGSNNKIIIPSSIQKGLYIVSITADGKKYEQHLSIE